MAKRLTDKLWLAATRRMDKLTLVVVLAGGLACYSTSVTNLQPEAALAEYPPVSEDSVRVYMAEDELEGCEFERLALIHGETGVNPDLTSDAGVINSMKEKAGKLGANGLLLGEQGSSYMRSHDAVALYVRKCEK
jgi:hypothetical protein